MAELLLVNPRKRRKHKKVRATRRRKRRVHRAARRVIRAVRRRHRSRRRHVVVAKSNPIRRIKRRRLRSYSHNPIGSPVSFLKHQLLPSAVGAAGALGLDVLLAVVPLPDVLKSGYVRPVVRLVGAVGLGMLASAVVGRKAGEQVAAGAITVTLYDVMKGLVTQFAPSLPLSGMDDYPMMGWMNPAQSGVGEYVESGIGEYVS